MSLPSLKGLRAFEAVARNGSFTLAASEIGVTQPAISYQICNLEQDLHAKLFIRGTQPPQLTPIGETLYSKLTLGLDLVRQSVESVKAEIKGTPLGVSMKPHFAFRWFAPRMERFHNEQAAKEIHFIHSNAPANFSKGDIHVSIEFLRQDEAGEDSLLLFNGDLTPACSPALLQGESPIRTPADLARHTLLHESSERTWPEWLTLAGVPDLRPVRKEFYDDTNVRQQAAMEGVGIALVCPRLVAEDMEAGLLVCPFELRLRTYAYFVLVAPEKRELQMVRSFINWLLVEVENDCGSENGN